MRKPHLWKPGGALCLLLIFIAGGLFPQRLSAAIAYVQGSYAVPQTTQVTVGVTYTAAQTAGNLNVVIVGWNDTSAVVNSVSDAKGNSYQLAVGPTLLSGALSQSIYYAKNIVGAAAGANIVTVTFSKAAAYPDVRVLEYSGIDTATPLDVSVGAAGTGATSSSGAVTTTNAADLLVGANIVQSLTTGPGPNFTARIITSPDGDIAEDRVVAAAGSYSATAPVSGAGWVAQLVAFRAAGAQQPPPPPTAPTYVQGNYAVPQTAQATVQVAYTKAQVAGDLNVVIVGWNDSTAQVNSVSDTKGNSYQLAVGPTVLSGVASQSIYYAKSIVAAAANANNVTVKFSTAASYPDVRVLEYSGIDPANPLDATALNSGTSDASNSGGLATSNTLDLLVGANTIQTVTTGPGLNFTARMITSPDGDLAEDRVVRAPGIYFATGPLGGTGGWVMQMAAFRAANSPPPDTTAPTVSITTPAAGATLTGRVTVTVSALDTGDGVAGVQLQVDGVPVGTGTSTSPYTFSLNTANFANGTHSLIASGWDFANNLGKSSPVSVTFNNSNSGNPAQFGAWSDVISLPDVSVHTALLPNGRVFMSDGFDLGNNAIVWNYTYGTIDSVDSPWNIFCNGMDQMADGRLMIVGGHQNGHVGLPFSGIFDPATESWTVLPDMAFPRWYPTLTTLPDGRLIVTSGEMNGSGNDCQIPEIYNPSTNSWTQLSNAQYPFYFYYPHTMVLPDGRLLMAASTESPIVSQVLDLNALTWTAIDPNTQDDGGSSAMYLPGKIIKTGTSNDTDNPTRPSVSTAYVLDMTQSSPVWRQVASMQFPRTYHNTTVLPDGNVLVTGGGTTTGATDLANAVYAAELWSPLTETWATLGSMSAPRLYHSIALLLPDGRVLISGGGSPVGSNQPTDQLSAQFFSPPYLFKGPRPVISAAPSKLLYGQNFTVQTPDAGRIAKVSLIRFGAVTHDFNTGQHFVPLSFSIGSGSLTVAAPANANLAPSGNYLLFLVDSNGIPSVAAVVHF